ncbi:MAG TPA: single-stranded-DNA-specific exonuclease RecJ [Edaphocola sp.]|nr:single-stranded-DNA-specific exonuclease RecJ [Edaphocola sp.]
MIKVGKVEKVWNNKFYEKETANKIQEDLKINFSFCKLLAQRGIKDYETSKSFFRPQLDELYDPFLMKGMQKATERISKAIANNEKIMIFGDYDVDGTTSVALVFDFLYYHAPNFNKEVLSYYIPHRYNEGYGLSHQAIDKCVEDGIGLMITLDCGIKSVQKIERAKSLGIDVIVCDHHLPDEEELPEAYAILNPKQADCPYPFKELSGCGIGFKLISALAKQWDISFYKTVVPYLDLVVTSIAADIVPINGENRVLAYHGLQIINQSPRLAIKLIKDAVQTKAHFSISDLVFSIAPRINAAGRMDEGSKAVAFFIEKNEAQALLLLKDLQTDNESRRGVDKSTSEEALDQVRQEQVFNRFSSVVFNPNWHKGVVGIVASRLIDHYYKPTIVLTESNDKITGSARSVIGFNIHDAIAACSHLLDNFGGHYFAAGLTMPKENFPAFKEQFEEVVKNSIQEISLKPQILIDTDLQLDQVNERFFAILKQFEPFGPENMRPVFISKNVHNFNHRSSIVGDNHIKFYITQDNKTAVDGIGFNMGEKFDIVSSGNDFDIVYTIEENEFRGNVRLQLKVIDIKPSMP